MPRRFHPLVFLLSALMWLPAAAQSQPEVAQLTFNPGQKVYVTAYGAKGQLDTYLEERLQKAFEKQPVFKLARKLSEADFVFVAYGGYNGEYLRNLTGFILTPGQYAGAKGDLDALREAALWTEQVKTGWNVYPEILSGRLVKTFHEQIAGKKINLPATAIALPPSTPARPPVQFQPGQLIYIAAHRPNGQVDSYIQERLQRAFEKQKYFQLALNANDAQFIFLVYSQYEAYANYDSKDTRQLTAYVLAPQQYAETKGKIEAMREAAIWSGQLRHNPSVWLPKLAEPLSEKLVAEFHQHVAAQPKTEETKPPAVPPAETAFTTTPPAPPPAVASAAPPSPAEPVKAPAQPVAGEPVVARTERKLQAGQTIYIFASRLNGAVEPALEARLRQAFEKQKVFKLAQKPSEAEVIFLAHSEYGWGVEPNLLGKLSGLAVTAEQYARLQGDLNALREEALWQERMNMRGLYHSEQWLVEKLVRKFHDDLRASPTLDAPAPIAAARPVTYELLREPPRDLAAAKKLEEESGKAFEQGQFDKALALAQAALDFKEKQLGAEHAELVPSLFQLAQPYLARQEYARGEALLARALAIAEQQLGANHPQTATALGRMAALYAERGDFARALPLQQRALAILEKAPDAPAAQLAAALNDLALLEIAQGQTAQAEPRLERALKLQEQKFGANAREVAHTLHSLAAVSLIAGDEARAQVLYERALGIFDGKYRGSYKALKGAEKVLRYFPSGARKGDPYLADLTFQDSGIGVTDTLNQLATIYMRQGKLYEAGELLWRAQAIERRAYGQTHPDLARTLDNVALLHRAKGDVRGALEAQQAAAEIVETDLRRNLLAGSERQKQAYLTRFAAHTEQALSLHLQEAPQDVTAAQTALTALLRYKGRALEAMTDTLMRLRRNADPPAQALLDQYAELRTQLSALQLGGAAPANAEERRARGQQIEEELEKIEGAIAKLSGAFRGELRSVTSHTVQARLPASAALVEFARYQPDNPRQQIRRAPRYAAYVLFAEGPPRAVDLGEAAAIERAIADWRQALRDPANGDVKQSARAVDKLLMAPVRKLLGATRTVLLSPDGALNLIPFAALVDEQDRYLVEQYSFTYLTSGRDLLRLQDRTSSRAAPLLLADPDFGAQAATPPTTSHIFDLAQAVFTPLPGTAEEAQALKTILPQARALTGAQATETALKQAAAPHILHIATHGFFLAAPESKANPAAGQRLLFQQKSSGAPIVLTGLPADPLLRSGLGLAGANLRRSGADDGILTAFEAAALNLSGTRLVVLSACDTGVGEVKNGEGVYGLRRALVLAGAETQVMSLWPVSDQGTRDLMIAYYTALQAGQGRSEAMRQVQLQMLQNEKRQHPYYWASFIVSGQWANLEGQ